MTPNPTQSNVMEAMGNFLLAVLPAGVTVVQAQPNRAPEPKSGSFVVMTPTRMDRLETNVSKTTDAAFTGSIAGGTMTISAVDPRFPNGRIAAGSSIFGSGLAAGTKVTQVLTGAGQIGTYAVAPAQNVGSRTLSAGSRQVTQPSQATVQLDFHSDDQSAGDMANTVSTLLRDPFGVDQFANQQPNFGVVPLRADDAAQRPFVNDQQQYEWRWVVEALLQINVVLSVPQEFADSVALTTIGVDATYPP